MAGWTRRVGIAAIIAGVLVGFLTYLVTGLRWPPEFYAYPDLAVWDTLGVSSAAFFVLAGIVLLAVSTRKG